MIIDHPLSSNLIFKYMYSTKLLKQNPASDIDRSICGYCRRGFNLASGLKAPFQAAIWVKGIDIFVPASSIDRAVDPIAGEV